MTDKTKHIIAGVLVALVIGLPCYLESNNLFAGLWAALSGVVAGAVKEYTDMSHEVDHLQDSILQYYDVSPGTEDAAYLQGYIMRGIVGALRRDGAM